MMSIKKPESIFSKWFLLLVVLLPIVIVVLVYANNVHQQRLHLGEFIANDILAEQVAWASKGGSTADNLVIIHVDDNELPKYNIPIYGVPINQLDSISFIKAWKYGNGSLISAERSDFIEAISNDVYIFLFAIQSLENETAFVDVFTSYGYPYRGRGEGSHWSLVQDVEGWQVQEKDYYISWD